MKDENGHYFGFKTSTGQNFVLKLNLVGEENHENLQINYISCLLKAMLILSRLFFKPVC